MTISVNSINSNLNCCAGDDCISIQTGCSNVYVHNVNCGPGHGISIGSLGKDNTRACVSNITIRDVNMHNTMNGVRIKTWQVKIIPKLKVYKTKYLFHKLIRKFDFKQFHTAK